MWVDVHATLVFTYSSVTYIFTNRTTPGRQSRDVACREREFSTSSQTLVRNFSDMMEPLMSIREIKLYQAKVGSYMYKLIKTRPNIAKSVGGCSQSNANPNQEHIRAIDRIISYRKGTEDLGILYKHVSNDRDLGLYIFVDADQVGDPIERKSTTRQVAMFARAAVSQASKKQSSIALGTIEAEYIAALEAAKEEVVQLRNFMNKLDLLDKIISVRSLIHRQ